MNRSFVGSSGGDTATATDKGTDTDTPAVWLHRGHRDNWSQRLYQLHEDIEIHLTEAYTAGFQNGATHEKQMAANAQASKPKKAKKSPRTMKTKACCPMKAGKPSAMKSVGGCMAPMKVYKPRSAMKAK